MRATALCLFFGPLGLLLVGRRRAAAVAAGVLAAAWLLYGYVVYLDLYEGLTQGGETAREVTDTAIATLRAQLAAAPQWVPSGLWALVPLHLGCAAYALWRGELGPPSAG